MENKIKWHPTMGQAISWGYAEHKSAVLKEYIPLRHKIKGSAM